MGDYPKRKRLRLKDYDYSQDGYYFLTICTKGRRRFLSEITYDKDGSAITTLTSYGKITDSYIKSIPGIDKYVIMPNRQGIDAFDFADAYGKQKDHMCDRDLLDFTKRNHLNLNQGKTFNPRYAFFVTLACLLYLTVLALRTQKN